MTTSKAPADRIRKIAAAKYRSDLYAMIASARALPLERFHSAETRAYVMMRLDRIEAWLRLGHGISARVFRFVRNFASGACACGRSGTRVVNRTFYCEKHYDHAKGRLDRSVAKRFSDRTNDIQDMLTRLDWMDRHDKRRNAGYSREFSRTKLWR